MEATLALTDFLALAVLVLSIQSPVWLQMRTLRAEMNQRFADAQKANDQAHAHIGENIRNLERRVDSLERHVDSGLSNVHVQLAAMTPRAMAAPEPPDAAPATGGGAARP